MQLTTHDFASACPFPIFVTDKLLPAAETKILFQQFSRMFPET